MMPSDPLLSAYAAETEASPADLTRLRARIRAHRSRGRRSWIPVLAPAVGLAAVGTLVVMLAEDTPAAVTASFNASQSQTVQVGLDVQIDARGIGALSGTERAPRLAWNAGTVNISVKPGAGLDVEVHTDEAVVRVVGTEFSVARGPLGTTVDVVRGTVAVACVAGDDQSLSAGETITCWPTTAAGLLGRAQALREQPAAPEAVLTTVERGLARSPSTPVHTELSALRVVLLSEGPDPAAAIGAAAEHLAHPEAGRREEMARVGAALGYRLSGCDGVSPFIDELPAEEVAASALAMCQTAGEDGGPG